MYQAYSNTLESLSPYSLWHLPQSTHLKLLWRHSCSADYLYRPDTSRPCNDSPSYSALETVLIIIIITDIAWWSLRSKISLFVICSPQILFNQLLFRPDDTVRFVFWSIYQILVSISLWQSIAISSCLLFSKPLQSACLLTEFLLQDFFRQPVIINVKTVVLGSHLNGWLSGSLSLQRQMTFLLHTQTDRLVNIIMSMITTTTTQTLTAPVIHQNNALLLVTQLWGKIHICDLHNSSNWTVLETISFD